jgi:hypothetical protein
MKNCYPICYETQTINKNECGFLCSSQCKDHSEQASNLSDLQVKCLLLCARLSYEKQACDSICNIKSNQDTQSIETIATDDFTEEEAVVKRNFNQGCTGYGSEVCYKLCRLHELESVETCYCACCSDIENDYIKCKK